MNVKRLAHQQQINSLRKGSDKLAGVFIGTRLARTERHRYPQLCSAVRIYKSHQLCGELAQRKLFVSSNQHAEKSHKSRINPAKTWQKFKYLGNDSNGRISHAWRVTSRPNPPTVRYRSLRNISLQLPFFVSMFMNIQIQQNQAGARPESLLGGGGG